MRNAQNIYQEAVVRLPSNEKLRLATLILQDLSGESDAGKQIPALELLENLPEQRVFDSAEAVDRHLQTERESWDN
jgi:hypothetical protein